jgi:proline iminopeptidase
VQDTNKSHKSSSESFNEGYLKVSPIHELWYAEYGNPKGVPVIVLHGGPGAGCKDNDIKFFDLAFWRVILLDQRGAKRSKPFGELRDNTTQDLIGDLEILRKSLSIDKWLVFGGSWGSALAIAYGGIYPERVLGFILRGIFLAETGENANIWYGMRDTFPEAWQTFNDFISKDEQSDLINAYYRLVMNPDPSISIPAARSFFQYDTICSFLKLSSEQLKVFMGDDTLVLGVSRTFIHYSANNFFLKEGQLIDDIKKINHLPLIIVNGRYDAITRAKSAYRLHNLWPSSELIIVDAAGHSAMEPQIALELTNSTEKMKKLLE